MKPIPQQPEDNLFPPSFKQMDEFVRTFAVGGDVGVSPQQMNEEGKEMVLARHFDRAARFLITRLNDNLFVVERLPDN